MTESEVIKKQNEEKVKVLKSAYYRVFSSDDGKKVLKDLEGFCNYNATSVCEQAPDAYQTFFAEGKRRVFLRILKQMEKEKGNE